MSVYPRERISSALIDSVNRGVAMLIAPAGFGKSEAAADAFGSHALWVDLPEGTVSVETVARLIIEKVSPRSKRALNEYLGRPETPENRAHLAEWCASRMRTIEQPIILDDFQRIRLDLSAVQFVRSIVEATVPTTRWVIISRETPELPIGTWLARDYMSLPIAAEDLSFDVAESKEVAAALDVEIDETSLTELVNDVSGWPLAVRLSLAAWDRTGTVPALRIRTRGVLFEFIELQVWALLDFEDQRFFEAAAYLRDLNPRVLGSAGFSQPRLILERLSLRLPLLSKNGNGTFRIHELFREFILERSQRDPERKHQVLEKLAGALERFGDFDSAISIFLGNQNWKRAIELLTRHGIDRIENGHRSEIMAALARIPKQYNDHPVVTALRGVLLSIDGLYAVGRREIEHALIGDLDQHLRVALLMQLATNFVNLMQSAEAIPILRELMTNESVDAKVRVGAAALLASAAAFAGEELVARDAIGFCSAAMNVESVELRALVNYRLSYAYLALGEAGVAEGYAQECVQLSLSIGLDAVAARGYAVLHTVANGNYPDTVFARKYAEACVHYASLAGDRVRQSFGLLAQLDVAAFQGDDDLYDSTERQLSEMGAERDRQNKVWFRFIKVVREGGRGNIELSISVLTALDGDILGPSERAFCDALLGLLFAVRERERAEQFLRRPIIVAADKDPESRRMLAHARVFHALGNWLIGRGRAARRSASPDLSAVTPRDAVFLTVVGTICSMSRQTMTVRQLSQLTEPLLALQLDGQARFLRQILKPATITQLTRSELEVLRALKVGGTTTDVADRLGKSSHTVLSHLKSACSKIGCSGRAAAVAYAGDMGWID